MSAGGTVDITAHEIVDALGHIREIHHAVGGAAGGTAVDGAFESLMTSVLGADVMDRFVQYAICRCITHR